jgi:dihydropyrimidinase
MVEGALPPEIFGHLLKRCAPDISDGLKIFTDRHNAQRRGRMVDFGDIWEVFKVVAQERGMCVMHGEDNDIVMHMY